MTVGPAFLVLSAVTWWRGHATATSILVSLGGALIALGLVIPGRLGPVYRAWMALARAISAVTTPIFMSLIYFLVMLPVGILRRVFGTNPVVRDVRESTYWVTPSDGGDMTRQF